MIYFAWVDASETAFNLATHCREDEQVVDIDISHSEGNFAVATVTILNPNVGFLAPGRDQWAWIARDNEQTEGPVALFFGRLNAVPVDLQNKLVTIEFTARPLTFEADKAALAQLLRVLPYYDPVWIDAGRRDDDDAVLEARTAIWHIDRVTHEVTISDFVTGEDGVAVFGESSVFKDSLSMQHAENPLRKVRVVAEVTWQQEAKGTVHINRSIEEAFDAAGSSDDLVTSFTGKGLRSDWPNRKDGIGSGWTVKRTAIKNVTGTAYSADYYPVVIYDFQVWELNVPVQVGVLLYKYRSSEFVAKYNASRDRKEIMRFTINADVQRIFTDEADDFEVITLASSAVTDLIDENGTGIERPIGSVKRRSFFNTGRGKMSLRYLIGLARAKVLRSARAVQISFRVPIYEALTMTCRMNATITNSNLPGGTASGKVVAYKLVKSGADEYAEITIGCMVGHGGTVTVAAGEGVYAAPGYMQDGYQFMEGRQIMPFANDITFDDYHVTPDDDGINFDNMTRQRCVESCTVSNGEDEQRDVLNRTFQTLDHLDRVLNEHATTVSLSMVPLETGPFETRFRPQLSALLIPKTIDLEAPT